MKFPLLVRSRREVTGAPFLVKGLHRLGFLLFSLVKLVELGRGRDSGSKTRYSRLSGIGYEFGYGPYHRGAWVMSTTAEVQ